MLSLNYLAVLLLVKLCCCVVLCSAKGASGDNVTISADLRRFLGTLEKYESTRNEVIFLLDESGSISEAKYPEVKTFTELVARRFSVSADKTRVAVISFSDYTRTHVNYIEDSVGNNMCTLMSKIHGLDYIGQGTATRLAMERSTEIFSQARQNTTKIIVLITDGQSNSGYDPVAEARRLKRNGVIIFAVGVADVNTKEIEDVATSRDHIYILETFDYIKTVNEKLINATKETSWDYVEDVSLCNNFCDRKSDCCDVNAKCYCGTMGGSYECNCAAGYHGSGHRQGCHECPKGTYKAEVGNRNCTSCPPHSTTIGIGSTSSNECVCEKGYEWHGNYCKAMECAKIEAPSGGVLIPTKCDNVYGTECKVKCKEGFCPYSCNFPNNSDKPWDQLPLQSRTCLETGKWSGNDFMCEIMRCPALEHPFSGRHNCSNFSYGTKCQFECEEGYELFGSPTRECFSNGTWSGLQTRCLVKFCEPLQTNQLLKVKPNKCSLSKMPYNSVCRYHCAKGYTLVSSKGKSDGINQCMSNQTWSGSNNAINCQDVSPPVIQCPKSMRVQTDPSKRTASVSWDLPVAYDNIFVSSVDIIEPRHIRKMPHSFPISTTKVVYKAVDSVNLINTCSFNVTVIDKEPPSVLFCPSDIELFSENNAEMIVTWNEPKFIDNSGKFFLTPPNKKSGTGFAWGSRDVISYNVTDPSGNKAYCNFTVTVKPYPCPYFKPPLNGMVTCDTWQQGRLCSVHCNEGYHFASKETIPSVFECLQRGSSSSKAGKWIPFQLLGVSFEMPIPDCSKIQKRNVLSAFIDLSFPVNDCSEDALNEMKKKFIQDLKPFDDMIPGFICPGTDSCHPDNVRVECVPDTSKTEGSKRVRRDVGNILKISFDVKLQPSAEMDENVENSITEDSMNRILDEVVAVASENAREVYRIPSIQKPEIHYHLEAICSAGQLRVNDTCMDCPPGTYKDDISDSCMDCPASTYQEKESSLYCLPCPVGYTTYQTRSKSFRDCKAPCPPGYFSKTSFEPCFPCNLNTFQEYPRRQDCTKCPHGLQTWKIGSNSSLDCTIPCKPGSYSDTGFEPCIPCDFGFYQPDSEQKNCIICPNGTSTRKKGTIGNCEEMNVCEEQHPCANDSTCVPAGNDYSCVCSQGYFGKNCDETNYYCEEDHCLNGGSCKVVPGGYHCSCLDGFSGKQCEVNIDDCHPGLCHNGGECKDLIKGYECICPAGFGGLKCEINIFDCGSNPCFNGGTCFDKLKGYKCCCPPGFTGVHCEKKLTQNPCDTVQCLNGGKCESNETDFSCLCKTGYEGVLCESHADECFNHTCIHDGVCINGNGKATCQCSLLFSGDKCQKALPAEFLLSFASPSTANYASIENTKRLYSITVAFFMRTNYNEAMKRPTPLSYSYYDKEKNILQDNALTFYDTHRLIIYIHGEMLHTGVAANHDFDWHHYALVWEKNDGRWSFFVDGKVAVSGYGVGVESYFWPGIFVLGQEQDSLGGTFSTPEAFAGDITEFNVWDYALSQNEIKSLSTLCGYIGNLISWPQISNNLYGSIQVSERVDLCLKNGRCSDKDCNCSYSTKENGGCNKRSVQDCASNPCQNEQPCVEGDSNSYCNCSSGYDGRLCEYDINECLDNNGKCSHFCRNTDGSYICGCPDTMILSNDNLTCKDTSFCEVNGKILLDGESWMSSCQECVCEKSRVTCKDLNCSYVKCHPEETLMKFPGECCPKCVSYTFCFVSPNHTVTTFGFSQLQFTDECSYALLEDCVHGHYSVRLDGVTNNLKVYQSCSVLHLNSMGEMSLDEDNLVPPFKNDLFEVQSDNSSVLLSTHSGVYIQWYANGEILLALPSDIAKHACGVCGSLQEYNVQRNDTKSTSEVKTCILELETNQDIFVTNQAATTPVNCLMLWLLLLCFVMRHTL